MLRSYRLTALALALAAWSGSPPAGVTTMTTGRRRGRHAEQASSAPRTSSSSPPPGTLTVGTDKPAFPPYFVDDDPTNGKGFESAVAYAVADELGFAKDEVKWTVVPFNSSYAPGPKDFDFDINQISITPAAREGGRLLHAVLHRPPGRRRPKDSDLAERDDVRGLQGRDDRRADRHHEPGRRA